MPILTRWYGDPRDCIVHALYQQPWDWGDMSASLDELARYATLASRVPALMIELPSDFLLPMTGLSSSFQQMRGAYFSRGFSVVVLVCTPELVALINGIARNVVSQPERFFIVSTRAEALALISEQRDSELDSAGE